MDRSTFVFVAAVRGGARLPPLVREVVCAAVSDLAIAIIAIGRMAVAHDALYPRGVVQIGVELPAFDVARGLFGTAARFGMLLFKMLVALVRQPLGRARRGLVVLGVAMHLVDALEVLARAGRTRRGRARGTFAALMGAA
ncbi:hypothetical protein [Ralstonia edaphi]|uniref:hypothetical protein n=1 Tax=Ralstonia edaphi TaxID=3058599 RepID=UPI00292F4FE5|nr:hypothetical protein [Ralstonia sp. LMG 6871]